jgi:hypothetical protein
LSYPDLNAIQVASHVQDERRYKSASRVIDSVVAGLILETATCAGRNLWASIFAHGFIDTFGIIDAFFGWSN